MDILFGFYILLFVCILAFPSVFMAMKYKKVGESPFGIAPREDLLNLREEREILLSNFFDLKAEEETGKMKEGEFRNLSQDLLLRLDDIDKKIQSIENLPITEEASADPTPNESKSPGNSSGTEKTAVATTASEVSSASRSDRQTSNPSSVVIHFCPSCGTKALPNAKFCHNCGYSLNA